MKHSSDLLMCVQFAKLNRVELDLPVIKSEENEDVTEEAMVTLLRRAISRYSTLQTHDVHWADYMFVCYWSIEYCFITSAAISTIIRIIKQVSAQNSQRPPTGSLLWLSLSPSRSL